MEEKCSAPAGQKAESALSSNKTQKKYGFAKDARVRLKKEFSDIIKTGRKKSLNGIMIWYKPGADGADKSGARMGITVSRRLGNAPVRNRTKRLLREVFRLNRHKIQSAAVFILNPRGTEKLKNFQTAEKAVTELWQSAGILKNPAENTAK